MASFILVQLKILTKASFWQKKVRTLRMNLFLGMTKNEIKVAAIGLKRCHLGQRLANVRSHLEKLKNQFGVHPAGEGACSRTSTFTSF